MDFSRRFGAQNWPPSALSSRTARGLIELYTFSGDVVLDPFMGSGTTALAALAAGRSYVGYETSKQYVLLAEERIRAGK